MKKIYAPLVVATAALFALTACSSSAPEEETTEEVGVETTAPPEAELYPAGAFELTSIAGAEITFDLPTDASDERLAEIEQFRANTGGEPVSYIVVEVDNRNGTDDVMLENIDVFDEDGTKYEFTDITNFIDEWSPYYSEDYEWVLPDGSVMPEEEGDALNNRGVDLYNANLGEIAVAENSIVILALQDVDLPSEFTRVVVVPDPFAEEEEVATPPSE